VNIPKTTLRRHLVGSNKSACGGVKHLGRNTNLPQDLQDELSKHILDMEAMVRKLAFQLAEINGTEHRFSREKQTAGKEWLSGFLRRATSQNINSHS